MITVVTSFNKEGYEQYGKKFLETFKEHWPSSVKLRVYYHDFDLMAERPIGASNISYTFLNAASPELLVFRDRFKFADGKKDGQYNYRNDAIKFSHKMFALFNAAKEQETGWLVWLDADTVTKKRVTKTFLNSRMPKGGDVTFLGRTAINYAETSFIAMRMNSKRTMDLIADLQDTYRTGELFGFAEWHDGYVFTRLLNIHIWHGLKGYNLSQNCKDLRAFQTSPLGEYMDHLKGNLKNNPEGAVNIKIMPKNAVPDEIILGHIEENRKLMKRWMPKCSLHDTPAIVVSGGPSAKINLNKIKKMLDARPETRVFCVKHSHNLLLDNGIIPFACVLLDPRPFDGISTHGHKRSDLIAKPNDRVLYFVASMVDPSIVRHLQMSGIEPLGWHAWTTSVSKLVLPPDQFYVTGGTCAATRSIGIAHTIGFRKFDLFGYDSCWYEQPNLEEKDEAGRPKFFKASGSGPEGKQWWTTGELLSQAQDVEQLMTQVEHLDLDLTFHGDGLVQDLVKKVQQPRKMSFDIWRASI